MQIKFRSKQKSQGEAARLQKAGFSNSAFWLCHAGLYSAQVFVRDKVICLPYKKFVFIKVQDTGKINNIENYKQQFHTKSAVEKEQCFTDLSGFNCSTVLHQTSQLFVINFYFVTQYNFTFTRFEHSYCFMYTE